MNYKLTRAGLIMVFIAQIIALLGSLLSGFIVMIKSIDSTSDYLTHPVVVLFVIIFSAAIIVLLVLSVLLNTVGILMSVKAERKFLTAFFLLLFEFVGTVALYCVPSDSLADVIMVFIDVMQLVITLTIIEGIIRLAERIDDQKTADYGDFAVKLIATGYVVNMLCSICSLIFNASYSYKTVGSVLSLISIVLEIVIGVFYLITLGKASGMLKKQIRNTKAEQESDVQTEPDTEPAA